MQTLLTINHKLKIFLVWCLRIIVGATFVFSGFVKTVDPWGFIYKIQEYLYAWGIEIIPREVLLCFAVVLAMIEFASGAMLFIGCFRRASVWTMAMMMAFLLPLTFYIMIANPVSDCGCFGDAWVISNTATFFKNLLISVCIFFLLIWNTQVRGLIQPLLQWIAVTSCVLYCLVISSVGYFIQPIVDFRPFPVGTHLISPTDDSRVKLIYEKDGLEKAFGIDNLPDSTWNYLRREGKSQKESALNIFDGDEEVSQLVISEDGPQLLLVVTNPEIHNRARSRMCNRLSEYMNEQNGNMIGLVAAEGEAIEKWKKLATPTFEVFSVEDTQLKELARGDAALVYLEDGKVKWKQSLYSLPGDFPRDGNNISEMIPVDDGTFVQRISSLLGIILLLLILISFIPSKKKTSFNNI